MSGEKKRERELARSGKRGMSFVRSFLLALARLTLAPSPSDACHADY